MAIIYDPGNVNVALASGNVDRFGDLFIKKLIPRLAATGRWQIVGSGNGQTAGNARVQRKGQTAGLGGSDPWNCLTGAIGGSLTLWNTPNAIDSFTSIGAWVDVAELDGLGVETGRGFTIQRHNGSSSNIGANANLAVFGWRNTPWTGVATSQDPGTEPTSMTMICGGVGAFGFFGSPVATGWLTNLTGHDAACLGSNVTTDVWMQLGIEDTVGPRNVHSWFMTLWSKTNNLPCGVMYYCELDNVLASEPHPYVIGSGNMAYTVGLPGNIDANSNPYHASVAPKVWAGPTLQVASFTTVINRMWNSVNVIPGAVFPPLRAGQNLLNRRPEVWTAAGQIGTPKYIWMNPFNRNYPSTQDVAGSSPRLYVGQCLIPWVTGVAPNSGP